jgi:hypothetical protein
MLDMENMQTYKIGDEVEAEFSENNWRTATIIGVKTRSNGQTFYQMSAKRWPVTWMTAKRFRPAEYDGGPTAAQFATAIKNHDEWRAAVANGDADEEAGQPW